MSRAGACGGRASGRGRAVRSQRRCALSRQLAVHPGGSALIGAPLSRRRHTAELVGDGRAGRAHPREWPHSGTCACTAARLRALRSTCAAQCNGAGGHHEGKVWRRRRRALGWAQGVCRAGRTVGGSTSRRDSWEGPADGNAVSAPRENKNGQNVLQPKRYLGESRTGRPTNTKQGTDTEHGHGAASGRRKKSTSA